MIKFNNSLIPEPIELSQFDYKSNGIHSQLCEQFLSDTTGYTKSFLTPSGTSSLEIIAQFLAMRRVQKIIIPSYTFTTSVLPFIERNISVVFCDVDEETGSVRLEDVIKVYDNNVGALLAVSYGGALPSQADLINFCEQKKILYFEDNAQAIGNIGFQSEANIKPLATMSAISFHYTKNITCGEGGALLTNSNLSQEVYEIVDKGTNRQKFLNGYVDKYTCTSFGSSHIMSELTAYALYQQLPCVLETTTLRQQQWLRYANALREKYNFILKPQYKRNMVCPSNGHIFGILLPNSFDRDYLQNLLSGNKIETASHYHALSENKFLLKFVSKADCPNSRKLQHTILRLPIGKHITDTDQNKIIDLLLHS